MALLAPPEDMDAREVAVCSLRRSFRLGFTRSGQLTTCELENRHVTIGTIMAKHRKKLKMRLLALAMRFLGQRKGQKKVEFPT